LLRQDKKKKKINIYKNPNKKGLSFYS